MIVVCILLLGGFVLLGIASGKQKGDFFEKMGTTIYLLGLRYFGVLQENRKVIRDLERLFPASSGEELHKEYYIRKWSLILKILLAGTALCLAMKLANYSNGKPLTEIERQQAGDGTKTVQVKACFENDEQVVALDVGERRITKAEQTVLLEECIKRMEQQLENGQWLGSDGSMELPDSLTGYPFEILWRERGPGELIAYFYYEEEVYQHVFEADILPDKVALTLEGRLLQEVERENISTQYEKNFRLPGELDGKKIIWKEVQEDNSGIVFVLMFAVVITVYFLKDRDLHEEWKKKKMHMRVSYPMVLNKFVLFMGAGMTVRGCFIRVAGENNKEGRSTADREIYQEMAYSARELSAGVSESFVYERFGKRTGLEEYTRFATMLSQNLKKGNATLLSRLREEWERAQAENLHLKKRLGEEAQTKLLLPMIMMMAIVMLLVMLPAFSSF